MKKFLVGIPLLIALVGGGAYAAKFYVTATEVQLINRATPLSDAPIAGEFLPLYGIKKIRLTICTCTDSGCLTRGGNLTGGNMQCWYNSPVFGWVANPDLNLAVGSPAQACRTFGDMWSPAGNTGGDMFCGAVSVTVASGTHLKVHLEGITNE